jgi:hypothetical protein
MDRFVPLTTYQGLSVNEIRKVIDGYDIYIWGCTNLGRGIRRAFEKNGMMIKGFCDTNPSLIYSCVDNLMVEDPKNILPIVKSNNIFLIIASMKYRQEIEHHCKVFNLIKGKNYLSCMQIPRQEAVIDITKKKGNKYMTLSYFDDVVKKLHSEMPFLVNLHISAWEEPLINPNIVNMIKLVKDSVPTTVTTNLQDIKYLEEIIKIEPASIIISASGFANSYEQNQNGNSWSVFLNNINFLSKFKQKYKTTSQITL